MAWFPLIANWRRGWKGEGERGERRERGEGEEVEKGGGVKGSAVPHLQHDVQVEVVLYHASAPYPLPVQHVVQRLTEITSTGHYVNRLLKSCQQATEIASTRSLK